VKLPATSVPEKATKKGTDAGHHVSEARKKVRNPSLCLIRYLHLQRGISGGGWIGKRKKRPLKGEASRGWHLSSSVVLLQKPRPLIRVEERKIGDK